MLFRSRIKTANTELEQLIEQKYQIESQFRKIEAEVGPIKYIAELIYEDSSDKNLLEKAVRYVILIIVAVFDPLALVLILAAQQSFRWYKEDTENRILPESQETIPVVPDEPSQPIQDPVVENSDIFNINDHAYLFKPWNFVPGGKPMVADNELKEPMICNICNSELLDAKEFGIV